MTQHNNRENYFVLAENVLGLQTNTDTIRFSYGTYPPPVSRQQYEQCAVKLKLYVGDIAEDMAAYEPPSDHYHHFSGQYDADALNYHRTFLLHTELRVHAHGFVHSTPTLMANPTYYKFIPQRFMNLHSIAYILTDMVGFFLLKNGYMPLHCSSFRKDGATVLIFAPPATGKTLTAMLACMDHGADYIAEDIAITDGRTIYSVPWTSTYRHYSTVDQDFGTRLQHRLTQIIPIFELIPLSKKKPITYYIPEDRLISQSDVTHIIMLGRGEPSVAALSANDVYRQVINFNHYQFHYFKSPMLTAYDFFNPDLDKHHVLDAESSILRTLTENVYNRMHVKADNVFKYVEMIMDIIKSG